MNVNHQVEDWKQIWVPAVVKEGIPGEKYLGKDEHGNEYTAHDVWRKKMIWKPKWQKVWKTKQVEAHKTEKVQEWKVEKVQEWKIEKKQDWVSLTESNCNFVVISEQLIENKFACACSAVIDSGFCFANR